MYHTDLYTVIIDPDVDICIFDTLHKYNGFLAA